MAADAFQIDVGRIVALGIAAALEVCLPIALAVALRKKLAAWWRNWFWGLGLGVVVSLLLASFLKAVVVRLLKINPDTLAQKPALTLGLIFLGALVIESARYACYRWVIVGSGRSWGNGMMFGLGAASAGLLWMAVFISIPCLMLGLAVHAHQLDNLPADRSQDVREALNLILMQRPWMLVAPAYEQVWQIPVQMAFALMVLEVFRKGQWTWLGLAMVVHTLYDFWQQWMFDHMQIFDHLLGPRRGIGLIVVATTVFGLLALALIASLRVHDKVTG